MSKSKGIIAYFFALFLFLGLYLSMIQRVVSEIAIKYSLDNAAMGIIITMTFIGYFISPILAGETTDRYGRRRVMLLGFILMFIGYLIALTINSPVGAGAGLLITGMAFGILELTMSSIITDMRPDEAHKVMNNSRALFAAGTITGPFLAMGVISLTKDWIYVMLCSAVLLAVLFIIFLILSYPKAKYPNFIVKEDEEQSSITFKLIKNKVLLTICVSIMMYVAVEAGLTYYVSKYINQLTTDQFYASLTLSVFWLFVAIGRMLSGKYKKDLNVLVGFLALLACVGLAICIIFDGLIMSIIAFGVMGLGCSGMFPTILALGKIRFPKYAGTVFGILLSSGAIGGILQPYIMGAVADATNLKIALMTCFVPLIIIIIMQVVQVSFKKRGLVQDDFELNSK